MDFFRISVIFRVRSAKAVKITDMDLIKRLGAIVGMFVLFLIVRTLVSPPKGDGRCWWRGDYHCLHFSDNWEDSRRSEGIPLREQLVGSLLHHK